MMKKTLYYLAAFLSFSGLFLSSFSQHADLNSASIYHKLQKLDIVGSVLYVAAHPDDENTRLITWLNHEKKLHTAYISLTRGDGGQNLIGNELGEKLGVIRTHELLEARQLDGGTQFFSRARDFGFSKHPDETFEIWDKEIVLSDLVYTVREFQPDLIITRFHTAPGTTHGHHTASALLAVEAFQAAGNERIFPQQLNTLTPFTPQRVVWNTSSFFFTNNTFNKDTFLVLDVGGYNPLLGESYTEIAARSRSQHKSQGFGTPESRGETPEYFSHLAGKRAEKDIFEGLDFSWSRLKNGDKVGLLVKQAIREFNFSRPAASVPLLLKIRKAILGLEASKYKTLKLEETETLIRLCLGLYLDVTSNEFLYTPGDSVKFSLTALNRSGVQVKLENWAIDFAGQAFSTPLSVRLDSNQLFTDKSLAGSVSVNPVFTVPQWLSEPGSTGLFSISTPAYRNKPVISDFTWTLRLNIQGDTISFSGDVLNRKPDPVEAEIVRPLSIVPPIVAQWAKQAITIVPGKSQDIVFPVKALKDLPQGKIVIEAGKGFLVEAEDLSWESLKKGETKALKFRIIPGKDAVTDSLSFFLETEGKRQTLRVETEINYPHIPYQYYTQPVHAAVHILKLEGDFPNIAYIKGAGDDIPAVLQDLGYQVDVLDGSTVTLSQLQAYKVTITGIRAFNTLTNAALLQNILMNYAENGGKVIVQYNTTAGLKIPSIGPGTLKISRDRVTEENTPVSFLAPEHPVLHSPNLITTADFDGWVQERGLYFPAEWSAEWTPILGMADKNETEKKGSLLIAPTGKGYMVYTGLSFFRQLPAGVPGATKLFANLIQF